MGNSNFKQSIGVFRTTSGTICQGNDSRLSDARTASPNLGSNLVEKKIIEGNITSILNFSNNQLVKETITNLDNNTLELTVNLYEGGVITSSKYSKYINGLLVE